MTDYIPLSNTDVTLSASVSQQCVLVDIVDNSVLEGDESLTLFLAEKKQRHDYELRVLLQPTTILITDDDSESYSCTYHEHL